MPLWDAEEGIRVEKTKIPEGWEKKFNQTFHTNHCRTLLGRLNNNTRQAGNHK